MNLLLDAPVWAQLSLAAILLGAAAQDIFQRRISNWLCFAVIAAAVAAAIAIGPRLTLWQNGIAFVLLLALGTALFAVGWLGGGDVKLLASLALWANFAVILPLIACILTGGGMLAAISLATRGRRAPRRTKGVPYGVAIAAGAAIVLLQPALFDVRSQQTSPLDLRAARERDAPR
jgi:prepilin peptidase CpaA